MAFVPEQEFPDLSQLIASLNNSQISVSNPALYQTIKRLIEKVQLIKGLTTEDIENINQQIEDLSNTINNFITGAITETPRLWMPTFDGEPGQDGFPIPGRDGRDGLDGKSIPNFDCNDDCLDPLIPFGPFCGDCGAGGSSVAATSEFTSSSTGNIDDLDFDEADLIRMDNATDATIRGLAPGTDGKKVTIVSVGAGNVFLVHQNAGSTAADRLILFVTTGNTPLAAGKGTATLQYDGTTDRWRLISHEQGAWLTPTYAAGDYQGGGGMVVTVQAADVAVYKYYLSGSTVNISLGINAFSIGAPLSNVIVITLPNSWVIATQTENCCRVGNNAALGTTVGLIAAIAAATNFFIAPTILLTTNWAVSANNSSAFGTLRTDLT